MFLAVSLALLITAVLDVSGQTVPPGNHMRSATFNLPAAPQTTIGHLYWNFTDTDITLQLQIKSTGWIGIGFASTADASDDDVIIGWVNDSTVNVTDRHMMNGFPVLDTKQNIKDIEGTEGDGWTTIKFSRPLPACEPAFDKAISTDTLHVTWMYGESEPSGSSDITKDLFAQSTSGNKPLYMLSHVPKSDFSGPQYMTFDVVKDKFSIPQEETHYTCRVVKLPELPKKHHIIKYEPVIQAGNEDYVYFMNVMSCRDDWKTAPTANGVYLNWTENQDYTCSSLTVSKPCTGPLMTWGNGATPAIMPANSGISIGAVKDTRYAMLEVMYYNPMKLTGLTDSSGIRMTYTANTREHDVGILNVGYTVSGRMQYIPPGAQSFKYTGACGANCLNDTLREAGLESLNVYQVAMYGHNAAKTMKLRHVRAGRELKHIAMDNAYDGNFQEFIYLNSPVVLKIGDELQMDCTYNTVNRTKVTQAGDTPSEEMCIAVLGYYPKIDFENCLSAVTEHNAWPYFGITNTTRITGGFEKLSHYNITEPASLAGKTPLDVIEAYDWTTENITKFETFMLNSTQSMYCGAFGDWNETANSILQSVTTPYVPPTLSCTIDSQQSQSIAQRPCESNAEMISAHTVTIFVLLVVSICFP